MSLTDAEIQTLLHKELKLAEPHPRPIQIGPLRYKESDNRCAKSGCGVHTFLTVDGIPYCTTHALHKFNQMFLNQHHSEDLSICECQSGKYSMGQCHAAECPTVSNGAFANG